MSKRLEEKESLGLAIEPGVFAKLYTVESIEDISSYPGKEKKFFNTGTPTQLAMKVALVDDAGKANSLLLTGWFTVDDKTKEVKDWNPFLNNVNRFLSCLDDGEYIEDDNSVHPNTLLRYIGKKLYLVIYYSNNRYTNKDGEMVMNSWSKWSYIFPPEADIDTIKKAWYDQKPHLKDLALSTFVANQESKKYADKEAESFKYGANAETTNESNDNPVKDDII